MDAEALLADLDPDQRSAVTTGSRLVAVIAGAGSGKTRVLSRRLAHRVATGDADARHTVVLTFTREAAGELRRRLLRLGLRERVTAGTFHSVAHELLRQRWIDRDERTRTITTDRRRILGDLFGRDGLDELDQEVGWANARGISPERYSGELARADRRPTMSTGRVAEALVAYAEEKRRRGIVDLDDLLSLTNQAMERDPEFASSVRWRLRHVLVDEAQDLNPLQHRFVDLLRTGRDDLFLVGDPSQAIYGFNGSDPSLLVDVADRFPGVEIVRLPVNHRSIPQIVDAGRHVLAISSQRAELTTSRPDGDVPRIDAYDDELAEAAAVARAIESTDPALVGRTAVLARTHATLALARRALADIGVEVRAARGPGSVRPLAAEAFRQRSSAELRAWANDLDEQLETSDQSDDPRRTVADAVFEFLRDQPLGDGTAFRTWVDAADPFGDRRPGVELLTFHGAKGREWHTVYVIGCETSLVPHRSATTNATRAEEARLLYVALTRATDRLVVTWAERRGGYRRKLSPLLAGIDLHATPVVGPPEELRRPTVDGPGPLERLHAWRAAMARAGGINPDELCSERMLAAIAEHRPRSPDELDATTGMGALTARRLYDGIAAALVDT